jgi:6-phosphogluconolactonase
VLRDAAALAERGAQMCARAMQAAVSVRGTCRLALSGGSTPRGLYSRLARPAFVRAVPWPQLEFFWGDERCVPPDDAQSNYRMAREAMLDHVPVLPTQVHRWRGEERDFKLAADAYAAELRRCFGGSLPVFDLVLLGLGEDGHTASLFPGRPSLRVKRRWTYADDVPSLGRRLTLTLPVLNAARQVMFLVAGGEKAAALAGVMRGDPRLPASRVRPGAGLRILADRAAAAEVGS